MTTFALLVCLKNTGSFNRMINSFIIIKCNDFNLQLHTQTNVEGVLMCLCGMKMHEGILVLKWSGQLPCEAEFRMEVYILRYKTIYNRNIPTKK